MKKIIYCFSFFLLLFFVLCGKTTFAHNFSTPLDEKRYLALTKEIRCVVCQNQSIADSNAPLARDLDEKIYQLINENKSDREIKNYLVSRYGEFILFNPDFNKTTFILWILPFMGLLFAVLFPIYLSRKKK